MMIVVMEHKLFLALVNVDWPVSHVEVARWSSGINAANGAHGPRFTSRILPNVQRPWTSR